MVASTHDSLTTSGHFCSGSISTLVAIGVTQPLITLKTLSQSKKTISSIHPQTSVFYLTKYLWSGFIPNAISGCFAESIAFSVYNRGKQPLEDEDGKLSDVNNLFLSCVSGFAGAPFCSVLEQVMIRKQLYQGSLSTHFFTIYNAGGLQHGVFKGFSVTVGREMCFNLGVFGLNDVVNNMLKPYVADEFALDFCSGMTSGACAGFLSTPLDRAKTLIQGDLSGKYITFRGTVRSICQEEGWKALFKGAKERVMLVGSLVALTVLLKKRIPDYFPSFLKEF